MSHAYPIFLDVTDRPTLIVGGGRVALRKAQGLLAAGARQVRCVSPALCPQWPPAVSLIKDVYQSSHLDGIKLVFAATNSTEVNDAVVRDAAERGILANRVDRAGGALTGDFSCPAVHRAGAVTVAVSAAGAPGLAMAIRDELATGLDSGWIGLADALVRLRPIVLASNIPAMQQQEILRRTASREALEQFRDGGADGLMAWLRRDYPGL